MKKKIIVIIKVLHLVNTLTINLHDQCNSYRTSKTRSTQQTPRDLKNTNRKNKITLRYLTTSTDKSNNQTKVQIILQEQVYHESHTKSTSKSAEVGNSGLSLIRIPNASRC